MKESKGLIFFKKHGINILLFLILTGLYGMCFSIPFTWFWILYIIVPLSAYIMHRYHIVAGLILPLVFGLLSFFLNHSNIYLFFIAPSLLGQFGLYFALKTSNYYRGALISMISVLLGLLISVFGACAINGSLDFPSLLKQEVLRSDRDIIITSQAKGYYDSLYPTEEEKAAARLPDNITVPDGVDAQVYAHLYAYADYIGNSMNDQLMYYLFGFASLAGGGIFLIGNVFIRKLLLPSYFYRPEYPVVRELKTDETGLPDMRLPKGFLLTVGIPVLILYIFALASDFAGAIFSAAYRTLLINLFALSGICFALYLANLPSGVWRIALISVIIIIIVLSVLFSWVVMLFALLGLADYLLNTRVLIKKLFK